jgi:hypothetical protein
VEPGQEYELGGTVFFQESNLVVDSQRGDEGNNHSSETTLVDADYGTSELTLVL